MIVIVIVHVISTLRCNLRIQCLGKKVFAIRRQLNFITQFIPMLILIKIQR